MSNTIKGIKVTYKKYTAWKKGFKSEVCLIKDDNSPHIKQFETDLTQAGYKWISQSFIYPVETVEPDTELEVLKLKMTSGDIVLVDKNYFTI